MGRFWSNGDTEKKRTLALDFLRKGEKVGVIAKKLSVSRETIRRWKR